MFGVLVPKIHQNGGSTQFRGKNDSPVIPIAPAHSKRKGPIDKPLGKLNMTAGYRQICNHFSEGYLHATRDELLWGKDGRNVP